MEATPAFDAFEDQEIGRTGGDLDIGGSDDRPTIKVRRNLHMLDLRHSGNFLGLQYAPYPPQVQLQDRSGAGLQQAREIIFRRQPLAGGNGDRCGACDLGHLVGRIGRHRFLKP